MYLNGALYSARERQLQSLASQVPIPDPHFHAVWPQESYSIPLSLWLPFRA